MDISILYCFPLARIPDGIYLCSRDDDSISWYHPVCIRKKCFTFLWLDRDQINMQLKLSIQFIQSYSLTSSHARIANRISLFPLILFMKSILSMNPWVSLALSFPKSYSRMRAPLLLPSYSSSANSSRCLQFGIFYFLFPEGREPSSSSSSCSSSPKLERKNREFTFSLLSPNSLFLSLRFHLSLTLFRIPILFRILSPYFTSSFKWTVYCFKTNLESLLWIVVIFWRFLFRVSSSSPGIPSATFASHDSGFRTHSVQVLKLVKSSMMTDGIGFMAWSSISTSSLPGTKSTESDFHAFLI